MSILVSSISCQRQEPVVDIKELRGEVFGSYYHIKYRGDLPEDDFRKELDVFFKNFNDEFSTYHPSSVIVSFNRTSRNKKLKVSPRFIQMLELAKKFHQETEGAFEPTLAPVIKAWGFGGGMKKQSDGEIKKAMKAVGFKHVKWDPQTREVWKELEGLELDVNAFAPGWAADLIGTLLESHQIQHYMVDISGEILFKGMKDDKVFWIGGIEKPSQKYADGVHLALKMRDQALATSGNYRQFFDDNGTRKSHIIDPRTGAPVDHEIASASVISSTAAAADAWGTAMMVLGEQGLALSEKNGNKVMLLKAGKPNQFTELFSPSMEKFMEENRL